MTDLNGGLVVLTAFFEVWFSEDVERLNGFLSTGYPCSIDGTGGVSLLLLLLFPLLNAFRMDAKEAFLENALALVAIEDEEE